MSRWAGLLGAGLFPVGIERYQPAGEEGTTPPDQRLYVILAALAAFSGFLGAAQLAPPKRWLARTVRGAAVIVAVGWSLTQANQILGFIRSQTMTVAETTRLQLAENEGLSPVVQNTHVYYRPRRVTHDQSPNAWTRDWTIPSSMLTQKS